MKKAAQWAAFSRLLRVLPEIRQGHGLPEGALAGTACGDRRPEQNFVGPPPLSAFRWDSFVQASPGIRLGFHPNDIFRTDSEQIPLISLRHRLKRAFFPRAFPRDRFPPVFGTRCLLSRLSPKERRSSTGLGRGENSPPRLSESSMSPKFRSMRV